MSSEFAERSPFVGLIYAVGPMGSDEIRYIGLTTKSLSQRRKQHLKASRSGRRTPFYDWLRTLDSTEDAYFRVTELVMSDDIEDLGEAERKWIAELRGAGHRLLNLTDGGLGPRGVVWTEAQRKAAGDRARGRKRLNVPTGPDHPSWGYHHTEELKAHWSEIRRGTNSGPDNPNFGKFGPDHPSYGHKMSPESRAKLAEMRRGELNPNFGKSASPETRAKMSAVRRGRPMPSSVRSAHTRYHTNKGVFKDTCRHCVDDMKARQRTTRSET